jgi:hypothetical protein
MLQFLAHVTYQQKSSHVSIRCQRKLRTLVLAHAAVLRSRLVVAQVSIRQRQQTSVFAVSENQEHLSWLMLQLFAHVSLFANLFLCAWHMLHFITLRAKSPARKKKFHTFFLLKNSRKKDR